MRKFVFGYFDLCTSCRTCELACSAIKFGSYSPPKAHIAISIESEVLRAQPTICIQCENAPCIQSCPTSAIKRDEKLGVVVVSKEQCTGCIICVQACPIEAIYCDERTRKAIKCDFCDGDPMGVKYCPTKALALIG